MINEVLRVLCNFLKFIDAEILRSNAILIVYLFYDTLVKNVGDYCVDWCILSILLLSIQQFNTL